MAPNPIILRYHFGTFVHWRVKICHERQPLIVTSLSQWVSTFMHNTMGVTHHVAPRQLGLV